MIPVNVLQLLDEKTLMSAVAGNAISTTKFFSPVLLLTSNQRGYLGSNDVKGELFNYNSSAQSDLMCVTEGNPHIRSPNVQTNRIRNVLLWWKTEKSDENVEEVFQYLFRKLWKNLLQIWFPLRQFPR